MAWHKTEPISFGGVWLFFEANISSQWAVVEDLKVFVASQNPGVDDIEITDCLSKDDRHEHAEHTLQDYMSKLEAEREDGPCGMTMAKADIECPNPNGKESA